MLPALRLAQERHGGWLPREAFHEVADALDLTPAYCQAVASFYDMLHLEPVGRHLIEVTLRTIECAGGCGWATVVAVDHRYREPVKPDDVPAIVEELRGGR